MKLRAKIVEKRGTLQVVVTYKDSSGKPKQKVAGYQIEKEGK
ncbi:hypothetical protein P7E02_14650 [Enterococcus hulanensis]|nr:hypothetical protein [Enterococcus hulanensis]MDT2661116.1 hypothetical protein [Enterococcus hulanensis]